MCKVQFTSVICSPGSDSLAHWLWLTGTLARWIFPGLTWHVTGFLGFWISGFLDFLGSNLLTLLVLLRSRRLFICWPSIYSKWYIMFSWKNYYYKFCCFAWKTLIFFAPNVLPLLTINPPPLTQSNCISAPMSLLMWSGPTVFAHTASLCVLQIFGWMQAKSDAHYCELRPQKTGSQKSNFDSCYKFFSNL